jgi:hypothetical protein
MEEFISRLNDSVLTSFLHINRNPYKALETGMGVNRVQVSVSLVQEVPVGTCGEAGVWDRCQHVSDDKGKSPGRREESFGKEMNVIREPGDLCI